MLDIFDVVFSLNSPSVDDVGDFFHRQNEEMRDIEIANRIASFYNPENRGDDESDAWYERRQYDLLCHLQKASEIKVIWSEAAKDGIVAGFVNLR